MRLRKGLVLNQLDSSHLFGGAAAGYVVEQRGGYLVMHQVPYVNASRQVKMGKLISSLTMAGDRTHRPDTHVMFFDGEYPCHAYGSPISAIMHQSVTSHLGHGLTSRHSFSSKPSEGYPDYHKKMTAYANILAGPAAVLQPGLSPRVFQVREDQTVSPFHYAETASDRAGIGALTERLEGEKVGIIGLGGTGSYILDQTAKTPYHAELFYERALNSASTLLAMTQPLWTGNSSTAEAEKLHLVHDGEFVLAVERVPISLTEI